MKDNQERAVCIAARGSPEGRQKKLQRDDSLLAEALQSKKFHSHKPEILCYHGELRSQITMAWSSSKARRPHIMGDLFLTRLCD